MSSQNDVTDSNTSEEVKQEFDRVKEQVSKKAAEISDNKDDYIKNLKKEVSELEDEGKNYWNKLVAFVKERASKASKYLSASLDEGTKKSTVLIKRSNEELKNPVVVAQTLVGISGAIAGYFVYLERSRINTDNKFVLGIHTSLITGLVLLDGYLFNKYYPEFDKKKAL